MQYKIREEKQGAMLFDQDKGHVVKLTEEDYLDILKGKSGRFNYLFDNNKPLFRLYKSGISRKQLPSDCLSAPSKVYFEITRKCNLNCKYCYNKSNKTFSNELNKEQIFSLLNELAGLGTFEIRFTGGEPTTHPDFFEIVKHAKKLDFFISLGTNGIWDKETLEKIKMSGIKVIVISLDGPEDYNDSLRGKGTFKKIVSTIKSLRKDKNLILKLNTVLCKNNKKHIGYVIGLADSLGIDVVNFATLKLNGRAYEDKNKALTPKDMFVAVSNITELRKRHKTEIRTYLDIIQPLNNYTSSLINKKSCAAGIEVAAVSPFGEVYGCVVSPANDSNSKDKQMFIAGNISKNKFIDVWLDSSKWQVYRNLKKIKSKKCLNCRFYTKTCFGNCAIESYLHNGKLNSENPYCFVDCLKV